MCRLVGWVSDRPLSLVQALGETGLADLIRLSHQHADGWGFAWWQDGALHAKRSPLPAHASADFSAAAHEVRSDAAIVHLRWATAGLPVSPENTHPFVSGEWAFGHNGTIRPADGLLDLLPDGTVLGGTTDSERLFHLLLAHTARQGQGQGIRRTIADVCHQLTPTSLNSLLLGPSSLTALCVHGAPWGTTGSFEDDPGYYDLRWRSSEGAVVVASEPLGGGAWQSVENGTALVVRRGELAPRVLEVGQFSPAAVERERVRRESA
jgi:predicted glutamine amidotransferase